jgi:pimeloyl-ACP methyl ester carboxylesterase
LQALTTRVGGLPTRYLAAGDGPPVVLVHGVGESAFDWRGAMAHLSRARRVYAPDLPLVGGTGRPATAAATGDFSPAYHARFLGAFLDALGIERAAAVIGASLHGHSVLRFALSQPHRASAVGVVGGTGLGREVNPLTLPTVLPGWGELATGWAKTPLGAAQRAWGRVPLHFADPSRVPEGWICEQARLARLAGFLEAQLAAARSQFGPCGQRETVLDDLPGLAMPILLVWGGRDRVLPVRHARDAAARLRKGRLEILPDCGHAAWLERPERFAGLLDGFLDEPERV